MTVKPHYTIAWNAKRSAYIASYKTKDGVWKTKQLSTSFERKDEIAADHWFFHWLASNIAGVTTSNPTGICFATLAARWLQLRKDDNTGTKPNTYRGFVLSVNNWILDNKKFPHHSIQNLDLETEFSVNETRAWINSLTGSYSSRIQHINTLRAFFRDAIGNEWLNPEMTSPMNKEPILKMVRQLSAARQRGIEETITTLSKESSATLLTGVHNKVKDYRRIRYLLAISTGMRDGEIQGLVWSDMKLLATIPMVSVERQLEKIGTSPAVRYEDLVLAGKSKDDIAMDPRALVSDPKYHSKRCIPLHPLATLALKWWQQTGWQHFTGESPKASDPVFPRGLHSLQEDRSATDFVLFNDCALTLRVDLQRLGLDTQCNGKDIVFHSLRHTFATLLEDNAVAPERIDMLLGHKASSTSRKNYIAKNIAPLAESIRALPLPSYIQLEYRKLSIADKLATKSDNVAEVLDNVKKAGQEVA